MSMRSPSGWKGRITWLVLHNPLYLLSAACMAVGARLYLVQPDTLAGDVGAILITLGVLQLYECLVLGILTLLHRSRRSPEDEPSLLLVAALFWTGPLAATIEMSVGRPHLSLLCSLVVLVFAIAELLTARRWLALRLSHSTQILAVVCFTLLVLAPMLVRVGDAADEVRLYVCWWLLAAVGLLSARPLRPASAAPGALPTAASRAHVEPLFLLILLAVTAAQLWGMNYAYCGHARAFYASPLLLAVSWVALKSLPSLPRWRTLGLMLSPAPALVGIALAAQGFDPAVPVERLPRWLHDPAATTLALAVLTLWAGAWRNHSAGLLHLGNLGFVALVIHTRHVFLPASTSVGRALAAGDAAPIAMALLALAAYLAVSALVRKSRGEALVCVLVLQAASVVWASDRPDATLIIGGVACWNWLIALHLGRRAPTVRAVLWPICALLALACCYESHPVWTWYARANMLALPAVLLGLGALYRLRRHAVLGLSTLMADAAFLCARATTASRIPLAAFIVVGGFALLLAGAAVSWHKTRLLALAAEPETNADEQETLNTDPAVANEGRGDTASADATI